MKTLIIYVVVVAIVVGNNVWIGKHYYDKGHEEAITESSNRIINFAKTCSDKKTTPYSGEYLSIGTWFFSTKGTEYVVLECKDIKKGYYKHE